MLSYEYLRRLLFLMPGETSQRTVLGTLDLLHALRLAGLLSARVADRPVRVMGLDFPNPVGLAAGLDKNGEHLDALGRLGFGFLEVGTVTPRPQPGNPAPRLFRLPACRALINRLGFNNQGVDRLLPRLEKTGFKGPVGVNIGKNLCTPIEDAWRDYHYCLERVFPLADYVTVNISSPNTEGLRDLQQKEALRRLLGGLRERHEQLAARHGRRPPLVVKLAPDLEERQLEELAAVLTEMRVDGVIATNTTIRRPGTSAAEPLAREAGGLSGAPLRDAAAHTQRQLAKMLPESIAVIGAGGIMDAEDALERLNSGAALIQLYTGLIYRGPMLLASIRRHLATADRAGEVGRRVTARRSLCSPFAGRAEPAGQSMPRS